MSVDKELHRPVNLEQPAPEGDWQLVLTLAGDDD